MSFLKRLSITFFLILLGCQKLFSESADSIQVIDYIYNFDFENAGNRLKSDLSGASIINDVLNLEMKWWEAMQSGKNEDREEFLNDLTGFGEKHNDNLSSIVELSYKARYDALSGNIVRIPFTIGSISRNLHNVNHTELDCYGPVYDEMFRLYESFFNLIKYNYSIERIFEGDAGTRKFISEIENIIEHGSGVNKTIGRYFLMKYYLDIAGNKSKAITHLQVLHQQYPENTIFTSLLTI